VTCDDGNICTDDGCDPASGCVFTNNTIACDDESACTDNDVCAGGVCAGTQTICDDENACTDDSCDPATGCVFSDNTAACDDSNACTDDSCDPVEGCVNTDNSGACDDGNVCTDNGCNPATGCVYTNNTIDCDDASACTENDVCGDGACSGTPIVCDDDNECTDNGCDPATGCEYTDNSIGCNDGSACTENDVCGGGSCAGTPIVCDDGNECTDNGCDPATGCEYTDNTIGCNDGNACTENDVCGGGSCSGTPMVCDDDNECTDNGCDPLTGCEYTNNTAGCQDGDACTEGDICDSGNCVSGSPVVCDDQSNCTSESCDSEIGCVWVDLCDINASCVGGDCVCNGGYEGDGFSCTPTDVCPDGNCSSNEDFTNCPQDCNYDLVVLVEQALAAPLEASFQQYLADLVNEGRLARVEVFPGGNVDDLKALLYDQVDRFDVEGALLVGNLPAAWYEQTAFSVYEQFPMDLYLEDRDATWGDADSDGRYDSHSDLNLETFVSRLTGTTADLQGYYARIHDYRVNGSLVDVSAFNFVDNNWAYMAGPYGLEAIYTTVDVLSDLGQTSRANYLAKLTGNGAEFVYQWIHSSPTYLAIAGTGGGSVTISDVINNNLKGSFFNLFDCSAARFTENNLGMTYTVRTDYGLAIIGSTKTGGIYTPWIFHSQLAAGTTWGESFRQWYNGNGKYNDEWYLGIIIAGDPLLTVSGDVRGVIPVVPQRDWTGEELAALRQTMLGIARQSVLGTYEEYRKHNPQFFGDRIGK
jgi:hypothetical protein